VTGRIVVVRHGETEWSAAGRHTSRTDLALTPGGRARAAALGAVLGDPSSYSLVLCSPLLRARETCSLAGFREVASFEDGLREWDYGSYEGLTTGEIRESRPDWVLWRDGCPGGESPTAVGERCDRVLARCSSAGADAGAGDVLLFAHGHVLRVLAARWVGCGASFGARLALGAGCMGVLGHERSTQVIERWNT
jgi:probable phosphoglycerate mutase